MVGVGWGGDDGVGDDGVGDDAVGDEGSDGVSNLILFFVAGDRGDDFLLEEGDVLVSLVGDFLDEGGGGGVAWVVTSEHNTNSSGVMSSNDGNTYK